ncbi:MAG: hypothetical protein AABP62_19660 [Planctomycetota bacterium]
MLTNLVRSFPRWLACRRCIASLVCTACLSGTLDAQQLRLGSSPRYVPKVRTQAATLAAPVAAPPFPLAQTFFLHSRPTATKVIFLDFDGHVTTGTPWNSANNAWPTAAATITTSPYSYEGTNSFSNNELGSIQEIWQRVSECFSPFDVDVTTQQPLVADLLNTGVADTRWGVRVAIGPTNPPSPGGGWGLIGGFGMNNTSGNDSPCFVFNIDAGKITADTCIHEAGHTLGLSHDGLLFPATQYYLGHGFGPTGWAPHMGAAYYQPLAQWSQGEYDLANNQEDDLAIIATQNGFGFRPDDFASTSGAAGAITVTSSTPTLISFDQSGVIETRTDSDWFKITAGTGVINLTAVGGPVNTMLDIQMDLYRASGSLVDSSNPPTSLTSSISRSILAGTYYVKIDGVGNGDPLVEGYTDYSSLGQYRITGSYPSTLVVNYVTTSYVPATKTLTVTGDVNANAVTVTLKSGKITVKVANGTKINDLNPGGQSNLASISYPHTLKLNLVADLLGGDDSISVVGVDSATTDIKLGAGADKVALTLCKFQTLKIDGGAGTDALITTTSTIPPAGPNRVIVNIP